MLQAAAQLHQLSQSSFSPGEQALSAQISMRFDRLERELRMSQLPVSQPPLFKGPDAGDAKTQSGIEALMAAANSQGATEAGRHGAEEAVPSGTQPSDLVISSQMASFLEMFASQPSQLPSASQLCSQPFPEDSEPPLKDGPSEKGSKAL